MTDARPAAPPLIVYRFFEGGRLALAHSSKSPGVVFATRGVGLIIMCACANDTHASALGHMWCKVHRDLARM